MKNGPGFLKTLGYKIMPNKANYDIDDLSLEALSTMTRFSQYSGTLASGRARSDEFVKTHSIGNIGNASTKEYERRGKGGWFDNTIIVFRELREMVEKMENIPTCVYRDDSYKVGRISDVDSEFSEFRANYLNDVEIYDDVGIGDVDIGHGNMDRFERQVKRIIGEFEFYDEMILKKVVREFANITGDGLLEFSSSNTDEYLRLTGMRKQFLSQVDRKLQYMADNAKGCDGCNKEYIEFEIEKMHKRNKERVLENDPLYIEIEKMANILEDLPVTPTPA
jgi:hypothetical protein